MIIAVDGPAASGKGTIARAVAARFGLPHLDTGLLYRAVALTLLRQGRDLDDPEAAGAAALSFADGLLSDPELRSAAAGEAASRSSRHLQVREVLRERQRAFAKQPGGAVLDGRDIGTVIVPDADLKLFVTAEIAERARRRCAELAARGEAVDAAAMEAELAARDERDRTRATSPLRQAEDAVRLDTSDLTAAQAIDRAIQIAESLRR